MFQHLLSQTLSGFIPNHCILCGEQIPSRAKPLCTPCRDALPWLNRKCRYCSLPLPDTGPGGDYCGRCLRSPPPFDGSHCLFYYRHPLDKLITRLKFNQQLALGRLLAQLLTEYLRVHLRPGQFPDLIIPMPLHQSRLRMRGFNQAYELARDCAKVFNIPIDHNACHRIKNTPPQLGLDAPTRRRNLRGAFRVNADLDGCTVAVVDDVMTTGSSMREISRELRNTGARQVYLWCIARTEIE